MNPVFPVTPPPSNEIGFLVQNLLPESSESSMSSTEALDNLDLHLSDSDQSLDRQTNTSTDVLDGDYYARNTNILEVGVNIHQEDDRDGRRSRS